MADSLKFGTSGLRGLASDLVGAPSARYTAAFVAYLKQSGELSSGGDVLVGADLRASSPAVVEAVLGAISAAGCQPVDCGQLATPALALAAQSHVAPAIMVTGSHIPADRNGLKFYRAAGEITKADEAGILEALEAPATSGETALATSRALNARDAYLERYRRAFPADGLAGQRIGVFQHSSVARDDLADLLAGFGASVVPLGRAEYFVPIDTEALSAADAAMAKAWARSEGLDALVSTDGDADRPLLADEHGEFIRGDMLGILTAQFLRADAVVTPVTSNSAIEALGVFAEVVRTRVGSPFVIAGMEAARGKGRQTIVGFEANGGVLLGSRVLVGRVPIEALPTRDAFLPILSVLAAARAAQVTLSQLVAVLPSRVTRSDRLEHVPAERTALLMAQLGDAAAAERFFVGVGAIDTVSRIDGLRFTLTSGDVVHYRGSGNAPELRCYAEAVTAARADALLAWGLAAAEAVVR